MQRMVKRGWSCPCVRHEGVGGSRSIAPLILNLGNSCKWTVELKLWPLYLRGLETPLFIQQGAGWASDPIWAFEKIEKFLGLTNNWKWFVCCPFISPLTLTNYSSYLNALWYALLAVYYWVNEIRKTGMGGECSTYELEEWCTEGFGGGTWGRETSWKT